MTLQVAPVELRSGGFVLDGCEQVVLCASLFYFRIPRELWASRLEQVRSSGYQAIDVYLPWNFHELAPGEWDFTGRRDVAAFLDLADQAGLAVIARPGPYICSEWDGGALPAWLGVTEGVVLRQDSPLFLEAVRGWFDQVLPLLAERQYGRGGSVVAVQLENELDFFDTADRTGYVSALRDMVRGRGIDLPLVACAGQGDLFGASGDVEGVVPACNFYPDDASPFVEQEVRHYRALLADRGLPLLVTETNRRHATLRRLLASGVGLIAPYLQASGYNFGFTPSVGNWGDPAGLMAHDYDFGGYLSPVGQERPEMAQARVLASLVRLLGAELATGMPEAAEGAYRTDAPTSASPSRLRMPSGGSLLAVPHLGEEDAEVTFAVGHEQVTVPLAARTCLLVLADLPLEAWGAPGTLELATGDLVDVAGARLTFAAAGGSAVVLRAADGERAVLELAAPEPGHRVEVVASAGGARWEVVVLHPQDVPGPRGGVPDGAAPPSGDASDEQDLGPLTPCAVTPLPEPGHHDAAPWSEQVGVWRGRTHYRTELRDLPTVHGATELLIEGAGDIVDLELGGPGGVVRHHTLTPFGGNVLIDASGTDRLSATVETWGHPNFDDARIPGMRLGAPRGLGSVWAVSERIEIGALWRVDPGEQWAGDPAPVRVLGGWSSTRIGLPITYRRSLPVDGEHHYALHLGGVPGSVAVTVDGERHVITQDHPWLHLAPGEGREIAITLPHQPGLSGFAHLLRLDAVRGWAVWPEPDHRYLGRVAAASIVGAADGADPMIDLPLALPLALAPGQEVVVEVAVPAGGLSLRFEGEQVRVAVVAGQELLGRVWLEDPGRPRFTGGDPGRVWLPGAWNAGTVRLVVRGTPGPGTPVLDRIRCEAAPE